jgi:hypothetical protein
LLCPQCGSRSIGKVAVDQYYCWECCIEFAQSGEAVRCFQVNEEGELLRIEPGAVPPAAQ